ncbi:MAG: transposase [Betaproteobacteria bacterium]|nr:MAG: transposase [Betaproteobacteria bacterium]
MPPLVAASGNGIQTACRNTQTRSTNTQPGKPAKLACVEGHDRTVRCDCLGQHPFKTRSQVQNFAARWLCTDNHEKPSLTLGNITPKEKLTLAARLHF